MKNLISILVFVFISNSAFVQIKTFQPIVADFPNLNLDTLKKYEALSKEYIELSKKDIPFDSLTPHQKMLMEDELFYEAGPYTTGELGCSWYCATGPTGLNATSQLDSSKTTSYKPGNAHDFDLRTAWVEGKPDYGIGEEINIDFKLTSNLKVTHLEIYNGYCKSEKAWQDNSRVKTFALYVNGKFLGNLNLNDTYHKQRFEIGSYGGDSKQKLTITLRIIEIYPGNKYMDTAISEINFDGTGDH